MKEIELPTWPEIVANALASLDAARTNMSAVRDELASDWQPIGSSLSDEAADARIEVRKIVGQVKDWIDQAKDALYREFRDC